MSNERFYILFERHIGFGVRWDNWLYPVEIAISVPFVTFCMCFGRSKQP